MDSRTVKQIATELGTNKNVIYRIIIKLGLEPIREETNGKERKNATRYTLEDFAIIKNEFIRLQNARRDVSEENKETDQPHDTESLIANQRAQIETLERELENARQTERELRELLSNQMELLRQSQEMNTNLTETIKREQEIRAIQTLAIETKDKPKLMERISNFFHPSNKDKTPEE